MTLDDYLAIGRTVTLGSHTFEPEAIIAFARKFDPQPFHVDVAAARASVFGGLCASGWHTVAVWMKCNLSAPTAGRPWTGEGPAPEFGPSPGFRNLKWPKPVFAGETVTYTRQATAHRPLPARPGWHLLNFVAGGTDSHGDAVLGFDGAVLFRCG